MDNGYNKTKLACYLCCFTSSSAFLLPPMLFSWFREAYEISYTALGTLVLINFLTQLAVDLAFSFFSHRFNPPRAIRIAPLLFCIGYASFAVLPWILPRSLVYYGLLFGTVIFSAAAGLFEVLLSPVVARASAKPDRDVSRLHSLYAYGSLAVILSSTLYIYLFGKENWQYLVLFWSACGLLLFFFMMRVKIPPLDSEKSKGEQKTLPVLLLFVLCIFFGGAAEITISNFLSSYAEIALQIPKAIGDLFGMAGFAFLFTVGRSMYTKYGKNVTRVLLFGMLGAFICYVLLAFLTSRVLCLAVCAIIGLCVSLLWPGSLILMEEKLPRLGVGAYALMAAGGDLGASLAPQLMGIVIDKAADTNIATLFIDALSIAPASVGMRIGMLVSSFFPLCGFIVMLVIKKRFSKNKEKTNG